MPAVLFICNANRFRSPLAEAAFQKYLEEDGCQSGWDVGSAGLWPESGAPALATAVAAAEKLGLRSIQAHRSRVIHRNLLARANVIIVMQASQREALRAEFPGTAGKIRLLSEVAEGLVYDIPDPFDKVEENHQALAEEICGLVKKGYRKITALAREKAKAP